MVAIDMNITTSPMVALPVRFSHVPRRKIEVTVRVAEARVAIEASAHQESTGVCAVRSWPMVERSSPASALARVKDWITGTLPNASDACSASREL